MNNIEGPFSRLDYLTRVPLAVLGGAYSIAFGSVIVIPSIAITALSGYRPPCEWTLGCFKAAQMCLPEICSALLGTINPSAQVSSGIYSNCWIPKEGDGLISDGVFTKIENFAADCVQMQNGVFKRQVVSRAAYLFYAVAAVATRVVDAVIGVLAAIGSILTVGMIPSLNNAAYRGLQGVGIIDDIIYCTIKCIRPNLEIKKVS